MSACPLILPYRLYCTPSPHTQTLLRLEDLLLPAGGTSPARALQFASAGLGLGLAGLGVAAGVKHGVRAAANAVGGAAASVASGVQQAAAQTVGRAPPRVAGAVVAVGAATIAAGAARQFAGRWRAGQFCQEMLRETRIVLVTRARERAMGRILETMP